MGQAKQRGTYEDRKAQALAAGRIKKPKVTPPRRRSTQALATAMGWALPMARQGRKRRY